MRATDRSKQIMGLVNTHSPLVRKVAVAEVEPADYHYTAVNGVVIACVKLTRVSWYQVEISHLVTHPEYRRQGYGRQVVSKALDKAISDRKRIAQCTVRGGHIASEQLFSGLGFQPATTFCGPSGNQLTVWQKAL